jgi:hypothetical protein
LAFCGRTGEEAIDGHKGGEKPVSTIKRKMVKGGSSLNEESQGVDSAEDIRESSCKTKKQTVSARSPNPFKTTSCELLILDVFESKKARSIAVATAAVTSNKNLSAVKRMRGAADREFLT